MTGVVAWLRLCLTLLLLSVASLALAQEEAADYAGWEETAARAERALGRGDSGGPLLEKLRAEIATARQRFAALRESEAARAETLRSQIDALGEPPEDGAESLEIASRRTELERQLAEARAPAVAAEEAYTRADGLIREIDATLRERQAAELLSRGPPPINPALWPRALEDVLSSIRQTLTVPAEGWLTRAERDILISELPAVLGLMALGLLLLVRGRAWAEQAVDWLRHHTRRGGGVWRVLLSLGQIFLPLGGVLCIVAAGELSGILSDRALELLYGVPIWLGIFLYVQWLSQETFSREDDEATMPIEGFGRRGARFYLGILAGLLILRGIRILLADLDDYSIETVAVLDFPLVAVSSLVLFRLGQILSRARLAGDEEGDEASEDSLHFRIRVARVLGRGIILIAAVSPVLAAAGYRNIAEALVFPAIQTLVVAGTILVVLRFVSDFYALVTKRTVQETNSLVPVAAGFVMALAALPVLALIWGARITDLTELWAIFLAGFALGETRISPSNLLTFLMVFVIGFALTRLLQSGLRSTVLPKTKIDLGGRNAIVSGLGYLGVMLAALAAFGVAGIDLSSLALVAGALSVGIGFGLQNIVQNFVSGIILLIERPIGEGDWIEVNGHMGFVKAISVRSTRIETFDHFDVIVPNGDFISGTVTNYTRGNVIGRLIVPVSVAYGSDTRKVESILLSIAREHPLVLMNPAPFIYFAGFDGHKLNFEIRVILIDIIEILTVKTEMNHAIAKRFAEAGIEMPLSQHEVWLRGRRGPPDSASAGGDRSLAEAQRRAAPGDPDGE
ncbi:DUF3772 domain-containing protein [Roseivivax sp. CAU 1761]